MKLYRNAIILAVILGLMVGAYVLVKNKKDTEKAGQPDTAETTAEKIIDVDGDKVQGITIEGKDGKLVFGKEEKGWVLIQPEGLKVDNSVIGSIAFDILALTADNVVEEKADDLGKYGLNSPIVTAAVKLTDGSSKVLELGNETPLKDGYYAKLKDNNKVYIIYAYIGEKLVKAKDEIRVKMLFDGKAEDILGISMERGGQVAFSCKKSGEEWKLIAPIEGSVNISNLGPMVESALGASISEFIEENPSDLDKYGLKNPAYTIELDINKAGKAKLLLGKEEKESGNYYAKLEGSNEVFTVASSSFNFLDRPLKDIIDVFAYIVNIKDVSNVVVDMDGQTTNLVIETNEDDKDKDKFTVNGKDATMKDEEGEQPFRKYYQALIGLTLSEIEIGAVPSGKPEITFTYTLKKDPRTMKVEFIPKDDRSYYVMRNGKYTSIVVSKKKFDEPDGVRDTYKKLMEAIDKKK